MYKPEMRGRSLAIAGLLPYLGPALGPIVGGVAAQHLDWAWLFYIISLLDTAIVMLGFLVLPESYTPILLHRKGRSEKPEHPRYQVLSTRTGAFYRDLVSRLGTSVRRPVRLLLRRPVMQLIALNNGINFAIYCIVLGTFADLFQTRYHETETVASLHYIAIAAGASLQAQAGGHIMDWVWARLSRRTDGATRPEYRIPYIAPGVLVGAAGLVWYGWAAERGAHWAVVDVGVAVFAIGAFASTAGFVAYTFDEFARHAASASAAARVGTYTLGFVFPIFAPALYDRLGYGWGNSLLAVVLVVITGPSVLLLWLRGPGLRAIGRIE